MLKNLSVIVGFLAAIVVAHAASTPSPLIRELTTAMKKTDQALDKSRVSSGDFLSIDMLRLPPHEKFELRNLSNYSDTGLPQASAIMDNAKADLDQALAAGRKVDKSMAATFLARYAWFRVSYAAQRHGNWGASYPRKRFRALVQKALSLDPQNSQALLMQAWLSYQVHKHYWVKHLKVKPPHIPITEYGFDFSDRARKYVVTMVRNVLKLDPHNFAAWIFLNTVKIGLPIHSAERKQLSIESDMGILRNAKHVDLFYFGYDKKWVDGIIAGARDDLAAHYPKYYEKLYGHLPDASAATQPGN